MRGESKTQGDWGEQQMETILNAAGLEKNIHYEKEKNLKNENQRCQIYDFNRIEIIDIKNKLKELIICNCS